MHICAEAKPSPAPIGTANPAIITYPSDSLDRIGRFSEILPGQIKSHRATTLSPGEIQHLAL
jgi:hypothetical protein